MPIEAPAFTLAVLRCLELGLIWLPVCGVLLGFLENRGGKCGHFVVKCAVKLVRWRTLFTVQKIGHPIQDYFFTIDREVCCFEPSYYAARNVAV
jgi:hypothetical protein